MRSTDSWLAFVTVDRVYMVPVYTPGFNFVSDSCNFVRPARQRDRPYVAVDESIWDLLSKMRATRLNGREKSYGALSRSSRSSSCSVARFVLSNITSNWMNKADLCIDISPAFTFEREILYLFHFVRKIYINYKNTFHVLFSIKILTKFDKTLVGSRNNPIN